MSLASHAVAPAGCHEAQRLLRPDDAPAEALAPARGRPTRTPSFLRVAAVDGALTSREAASAAAAAIADALAATGVAVFSGGLAADAIAAVRPLCDASPAPPRAPPAAPGAPRAALAARNRVSVATTAPPRGSGASGRLAALLAATRPFFVWRVC